MQPETHWKLKKILSLYLLYRYGLPVNFQAILIEPNKKSVKRLRDVLNQLYGHLDGASAGGNVNSADVSRSNWIIYVNIESLISHTECGYTRLGLWPIWILSVCVLQGEHRYGWANQALRRQRTCLYFAHTHITPHAHTQPHNNKYMNTKEDQQFTEYVNCIHSNS